MAKRKIVTGNDPVLRTVCRPVGAVTPRIRELMDDMVETMRDANGVGLAAPQVGILRRVIVVEVEPGQVYMLADPEITASSGEQEGNEGCLSVPGESGCVRRPMNVTVKGTGPDGNPVTVEAEGFLARAFCHEIDHLDGILYTDKALYMNEPEAEEEEKEKKPEKMSPAAFRKYRKNRKDR